MRWKKQDKRGRFGGKWGRAKEDRGRERREMVRQREKQVEEPQRRKKGTAEASKEGGTVSIEREEEEERGG